MKKAVCLTGVVLVLLLAITIPGHARDSLHSRGGGHYGGGHYGGGHYGGGYYGGYSHGGGHFGGSIWIGPGWGGWGGWGLPYYYPYYPYYPYYREPAVIQQRSPVYVEPQQPEEQYYWYFCQDPEGYYPYIKKCHKRWLKVIPPAPPEEEE